MFVHDRGCNVMEGHRERNGDDFFVLVLPPRRILAREERGSRKGERSYFEVLNAGC